MSNKLVFEQLSIDAKVGNEAWQNQMAQIFLLNLSLDLTEDHANLDAFFKDFKITDLLQELQDAADAQAHCSIFALAQVILDAAADFFQAFAQHIELKVSQNHPHIKTKVWALTLEKKLELLS